MWNTYFIQPIYNVLIFIYNILPYKDMGVAIIVLTLIIRFVLLPFTWQSIKSQRILQSLNPELEKLKAKYHGNQEKLSQATMEFYKKHKVNPFSSCLPMLIQLPILFALYQVLQHSFDTSKFDLLYPFISPPDSLNHLFFGIIDLSKPFWPLAIVTGIAQFFQGYLLQPAKKKTPPKTAKNNNEDILDSNAIASSMTNQFVYIMPLFTVFIAWNLFAGLPLYWITTTLFSVISQLIIIKIYPVDKIVVADKEFHEHPDHEFTIEPEVIESYHEKNVDISVKKRN
ncbi:MAG: YidC/Oxa1 family membrane protein insertase [Patescibacteria group bacterium]